MDAKCFFCDGVRGELGDNPPAADCCEFCYERNAAYQEAAQDAFDEIICRDPRNSIAGYCWDETEALNDRYQIYLDSANDRNGKSIKTFDEWLNS